MSRVIASPWEYNVRSRQHGWIMPEEDIPSMLHMIEQKIASSSMDVQHWDALIRLRHVLEEDLQRIGAPTVRRNAEGAQQSA